MTPPCAFPYAQGGVWSGVQVGPAGGTAPFVGLKGFQKPFQEWGHVWYLHQPSEEGKHFADGLTEAQQRTHGTSLESHDLYVVPPNPILD